MPSFNRRSFLGTSVRGLAAALAAGPQLIGRASATPQAANVGADETMFLTWQRDPTTTMTVQWVGPDLPPSEAAISFAPAAGGPWVNVRAGGKSFPLTHLNVFRAELTGLHPGAEYQFRVGSASTTYHFRTMPAKANDSFTFVSGGDCGVNAHVAAVNSIAAKQDPYFSVIGGDIAYDNGSSADSMLGFLRNYHRYMVDTKGRLIPMVACIGNHEVTTGYNGKRSDAPFFFALFDGLFHDTSYATLDFGDYLSLVLLDTGHIAHVEGEQTDWLAGTLKARADKPHLVVVNHVPAYPSYRPKDGTGDGNRQHWVPLFERHGVDVVLEHHDHTFKRTFPMKGGHIDENGIIYMGDGSWGQLRAPSSPEERPYLAAVGQAYHVTLHRLEGSERFHMALEESGKIVDVCSTGKRVLNRRVGR